MPNLELTIKSTKKFQSLLLELAQTMGFMIKILSENRIYQVINEVTGKSIFLYNADLGMNSSSSLLAAKDKAATYGLMSHYGVPTIEHIQIDTGPNSDYISECTKYLQDWGKLVLKDNEGTQGRNVFLVEDQESLLIHLDVLKKRGKRICVSRFYDAELETRCIVYNGEVRIAFSKLRTNSWKHNLSQGAMPIPIQLNSPESAEIQHIAVSAAAAIGMRFCSIDIMETSCGPKVLEVNGTVLMNHYTKYSEAHKNQSLDLYREIFSDILE